MKLELDDDVLKRMSLASSYTIFILLPPPFRTMSTVTQHGRVIPKPCRKILNTPFGLDEAQYRPEASWHGGPVRVAENKISTCLRWVDEIDRGQRMTPLNSRVQG